MNEMNSFFDGFIHSPDIIIPDHFVQSRLGSGALLAKSTQLQDICNTLKKYGSTNEKGEN